MARKMEESEKFEFKDVMLTFEALAARLDSLDGMYAWTEEIDLIRKALEKAGF
jgi:hypothetical protein